MQAQRRNQRSAEGRERRRGAVFVEFALGFIVFLMLMFGIFEGARMIWAYATISHAAREGARFAMVHGHQGGGTDAAIETWVENRAPGLNPADVTVTTTWGDAAKSGSSVVAVQVSYPMTMIAAPMLFGHNTMNLSYTARGTVAE